MVKWCFLTDGYSKGVNQIMIVPSLTVYHRISPISSSACNNYILSSRLDNLIAT